MSSKPSSEVSQHTKNKGDKARVHVVILTLLLIVSVLINVLLAQRVGQLKGAISTLKSEGRLKVGSNVPPISAKNISGEPVLISYQESTLPTVLYIFTPQCGWCLRNMESMKSLVNNTRREYRFIGLSLTREGLQEYANKYALEFPVYTDLTNDIKSAYKMGGTPQTIVISAEGSVQKSWTGAYTENIKEEVEEFFHTRLPPLS